MAISTHNTPQHHDFERPARALVMGLGVHGGGLGVARWLLRQGVHVTVTDMASAEKLEKPLAALEQAAAEAAPTGASIRYVLGEHRAEDFTSHDMVVVNPAVRPDSPWLALAQEAGARIETEMSLFFAHCPGPILGITGTKGKTTTATLTGAILHQSHPDTVIAGNLRVSALEALAHITPTTPVVLELSSFQLMRLGMVGISPPYAAITNFSPDHLNYHHTMEEYARAKQHIFIHQRNGGVLVLHHDEAAFWLNLAQAHADPANSASSATLRPAVTTFSLDPESGATCVLMRNGSVVCEGVTLFQSDDVHLPGLHNVANAMVAAVLAYRFGCPVETIRAAICAFRGVKHRLELVAEIEGVQFVNDTTATNPTATLAALASFDAPIVLLAGGADKDLTFDAMAQAIVQRTKALVLLAGSATSNLEHALGRVLYTAREGSSCQGDASPLHVLGPYSDFGAAIVAAQGCAEAGDIVLLSPGCASFGMFRNEFHRGDEFRRIVTSLAHLHAAELNT